MTYFYSPLLEIQFIENELEHKVFIEAIVDEVSEYTGRHRATVDESNVAELTWKEDGRWEETGAGETERAALIGQLIADNDE